MVFPLSVVPFLFAFPTLFLSASVQKRGLLGRSPDCPGDLRWFYIGGGKKPPAGLVNLRAIDETVWTVLNDVTGEVVEEIEESKAFFQIYEGAVYVTSSR